MRIIEFVFRIADPAHSLIDVTAPIYFADAFALYISICVELTLILTMHWLFLSLKLVLGEIGLETIKRSKCIASFFVLMYASTYLALDMFIWVRSLDKGEYDWIQNFLLVCYFVLTIMYTIVILRLNRVMKRLSGSFRSEKRSINCQFFMFLIAYLYRMITIASFESN